MHRPTFTYDPPGTTLGAPPEAAPGAVQAGAILSAKGELQPSAAQARALDATFQAFAAACANAVRAGRAAGTTANALIHRRCYDDLRARHGLSANLAVRAIARAARELKAGAAEPEAVEYDARVCRIEAAPGAAGAAISLSTVHGRLRGVPFAACAGGPRASDLARAHLLHARLTRPAPGRYVLDLKLRPAPAP